MNWVGIVLGFMIILLVQLMFDASPTEGLIIYFVVATYVRVNKKEQSNVR